MEKLIECKICGRVFTKLGRHVRGHGLSPDEYRKQYGQLRPLDAVIEKINDLFITTRKKWGLYYTDKRVEGAVGIRTNNAERRTTSKTPFWDRPLTDKDIERHLRGGDVPIVMFLEGQSKFLCFDIDASTEAGYAQTKNIARDLIQELEEYFAPGDIHLEFSGNKGYHIWMFFDKLVPTDALIAFAKEVSSFNAGNVDVNIELRPESARGKGIKLPLGIHPRTGNQCTFLDKTTFDPLEDQYGYLSDIRRVPWINYEISEEPPKEKKATPRKHTEKVDLFTTADKDNLSYVWENGLPGPGHRNRYTFLLAIWLKVQGLGPDEVKQQLYSFTDREYSEGRTKDSAEKAWTDIGATVDNVFKRNLTLRDTKLTDFDKAIINLQKKSVREVFALAYQLAKLGHQDGYFYLSTDYLARCLGKHVSTIKRQLVKLEDSVLHRPFRGIPVNELTTLRQELLPQELEKLQVPQAIGEFEEFLNPEVGEASLFSLPVLKPLFHGEFNYIPPNLDLIEEYGWARNGLDYCLSKELYFKEKIISNQGKPFPEEIEQYLKGRADNIKNEFFQTDAWLFANAVFKLEEILCAGQQDTGRDVIRNYVLQKKDELLNKRKIRKDSI